MVTNECYFEDTPIDGFRWTVRCVTHACGTRDIAVTSEPKGQGFVYVETARTIDGRA